MPTPDEEKAAERAADDVDVDAVADHFEDMMAKGAHVRGEGQIDPRD
jgi:fructose-1,6-bisphosphatase/sedoheptulose 1,7-bisphosphatase-like protein